LLLRRLSADVGSFEYLLLCC